MHDYLSFCLGGLEYGVAFDAVREVRLLPALERNMADSAVAFGHGLVIPLLDLRAGFDSKSSTPTDVIVLQLRDGLVGLVVDGGGDVVRVRFEQVLPLPDGPDYLSGLAEVHGRRLILIDIARLMQVEQARMRGQGCAIG